MKQTETPAYNLMKRLLEKGTAEKANPVLSIALNSKPWDGMDSLDSFIKNANKYKVITESPKASKLLGSYTPSSRAQRNH